VTNLKAAAGAEGLDHHIYPEAVERVQRLDRHIRSLNQRLAPAPPPTPGVVRVPPAYQPHHTPPSPQPGGPTPGL
jgi:hypothetical protein